MALGQSHGSLLATAAAGSALTQRARRVVRTVCVVHGDGILGPRCETPPRTDALRFVAIGGGERLPEARPGSPWSGFPPTLRVGSRAGRSRVDRIGRRVSCGHRGRADRRQPGVALSLASMPADQTLGTRRNAVMLRAAAVRNTRCERRTEYFLGFSESRHDRIAPHLDRLAASDTAEFTTRRHRSGLGSSVSMRTPRSRSPASEPATRFRADQPDTGRPDVQVSERAWLASAGSA